MAQFINFPPIEPVDKRLYAWFLEVSQHTGGLPRFLTKNLKISNV